MGLRLVVTHTTWPHSKSHDHCNLLSGDCVALIILRRMAGTSCMLFLLPPRLQPPRLAARLAAASHEGLYRTMDTTSLCPFPGIPGMAPCRLRCTIADHRILTCRSRHLHSSNLSNSAIGLDSARSADRLHHRLRSRPCGSRPTFIYTNYRPQPPRRARVAARRVGRLPVE